MRSILLVTTLACVLLGGWAQAATKTEQYVTKLCDDTVVALQKTDAAPLVPLFSTQTSSFLVAEGDKAIHLSRERLKKMDKWGEAPLFTAAAKVTDLKLTDRDYAVHVVATVEDGDKSFTLDGVSTREGEGHKWLMLALLPDKPEPSDAATSDFNKKAAAIFSAWKEGLAMGDNTPLLATLSPDDVAICVIGPDYGFYTFASADDFQAALQQVAQMGGAKLTGADKLTGTLRPPVAAMTGQWQLTVGTMQPMTEDLWTQFYLENGQWKVAGLCAMPTDQ